VIVAGDDVACPLCHARVLRFGTVEDSVALAPGTGRCATHPAKEAVDGCGRCGAFVCELCRTRTGGQVLCPQCFDALHERGELETTRPSRFRMEHFATSLLVSSVLIPFFGCIAVPAALGLAVWGLARARKEPWISVGHCVGVIVFGLLMLVGGYLVAVGGMWT
jgi:hypothetical protein